jgi:hypothetical protein
MANLNLILRFRMDRDAECRVKGAARIRVDGEGVTLIDAFTGESETLPPGCTEIMSIQSIPGASRSNLAA